MADKLTNLPNIDKTAAIDLVMEMMAIPGKSCEEALVAKHIHKRLIAAGIPKSAIQHDTAHKRSENGGQVGNLIVKLPGTLRAPRRLLMAHIDTVPLCVGCQPVRKGAFIHSRDSNTALGGDDRAGASVVLNAILTIYKNKLPHPPLTLFWPVQEEIGLRGARYVTLGKLGKPKQCFNWDGGAPNMAVIGATGDYDIQIEINGIASHAGGHPEDGVSATAIAALATTDLVENGWHGLIQKGRNEGTSNIGVIAGGDATNVVTPKLNLRAEARSHDPKFRKRIVNEFRKAFDRAVHKVQNAAGETGSVNFQADLKYESFRISPNEPTVQTALAAVEAIGLPPETRTCNGGLDANWLIAHGYPTVTLGCGQQGIHTVDETLHVASYLNACRIGLLLATGIEE